ncbi:MAG: GNAT family N-acetyltransferase [Chloroflexota bacterium]
MRPRTVVCSSLGKGEHAVGCIALGRLSDTICEVRTLFVRPEFRGLGAGRQLVNACLQKARDLEYDRARLDTLSFMNGAIKLYTSFGFYPIDPYLDVSDDLRRHIRFFELQLNPA